MNVRRALALIIAALLLSACTPREAVFFWFGDTPQLHDQATAIVDCETGHTWDPNVVSPTNDHGLFQINAYYHRAQFERVTGQPWHKVYEPFWNARYARWLYDQKGWQPWACSR